MTSTPIILCPLRFEANALAPLERAGLATIQCTGPGPKRIGQAVSACPDDRPLVLAGLATALTAQIATGEAVWAERLCTVDALPTLKLPPSARRVPMCEVRAVLPNQPCRLAIAKATGAMVADLECVAMARAAHDRRSPWGVIRGISDDLNADLPPVQHWIDANGDTRPRQVAMWLALHPLRARRLLRLRDHATLAMANVYQALEEAITTLA